MNADGAVERCPTHDLSMHMVQRRAAHLPQAMIGFMPMVRDAICKRRQHRARILIKTPTERLENQSPIEDFAIDVDLKLSISGVADAHRPAVSVALEAVDYPLFELDLAKSVLVARCSSPGIPRRTGVARAAIRTKRASSNSPPTSIVCGPRKRARPWNASIPFLANSSSRLRGAGSVKLRLNDISSRQSIVCGPPPTPLPRRRLTWSTASAAPIRDHIERPLLCPFSAVRLSGATLGPTLKKGVVLRTRSADAMSHRGCALRYPSALTEQVGE